MLPANGLNVVKKLSIVLVLFFYVLYIYCYYDDLNIYVFVSFCVIIFFSCSELLNSKYSDYGLHVSFYTFSILFLGLAPLIQFAEGVVLWGGSEFETRDYLLLNILILFLLFIHKIIYSKELYRINRFHYNCFGFKNNHEISLGKIVIVSTLISIYVVYSNNFNFDQLFLRYRDANFDGGLVSIDMINRFFIRPIPAICLLLVMFIKNHSKLAEIYLLILTLITNAPTAIPRFSVGAIYIPLLFVYAKWIRRRYNLTIVMFLAVLVVFPLLNLFRTLNFKLSNRFVDMFLTGHFDSYQMFLRVFEEDMITWGYQLLGVFLFFVPRSLWPEKPIGSGYVIAHENNYIHDNLSMNFFGEGYINFGIFGSIVFVVFLALLNARLDAKFWSADRPKTVFVVGYLVGIGFEFTILRGALMNIFPAFVGSLMAIILTNTICKK